MNERKGTMTKPVNEEGYDVIGDVHGHADKLVQLLRIMGYEPRDGAWRHPKRTAIFVGDLIDRGPDQVGTVAIARAMVDAGAAKAVVGNHEFNAVAWHTPDPINPGRHLREHNQRNRNQHSAFLEQVGEWSWRHNDMIEWFMTLPLWLDLGELRVVHACWDPAGFDTIRSLAGEADSLTATLVERGSRKGSDEYGAIEKVLKGPEIAIPERYLDGGGDSRSDARFRWWLASADRLDIGAHIPPGAKTTLGEPYPVLPDDPIEPPVKPYTGDVPVIYGHYWETGKPTITGKYTACVDYSAAHDGPLVAYRWSDEAELSSDLFVSSDSGATI